MRKYYSTDLGTSYLTELEEFLNSEQASKLQGKVNLIFTSPPFLLNRKKKYGNLSGEDYINWFEGLAGSLTSLLTEDGSIVIELGNAWEKGTPTMSTLPLESLIGFKITGGLKVCQQFIWQNPAKLPSPAEWVNVRRIRVKDSFTHIWWMSKTAFPKANNRNVLVDYSDSMKGLLKRKKYNGGTRPSEHSIGKKSFFTNNKGAIPPSVLVASNTRSNTEYHNYCNANGIKPHPARMPEDIPDFFIKFLTDPGDLVFDPFGGSNTTGYVAEQLGRRWLITDREESYLEGSVGRFINHNLKFEHNERSVKNIG